MVKSYYFKKQTTGMKKHVQAEFQKKWVIVQGLSFYLFLSLSLVNKHFLYVRLCRFYTCCSRLFDVMSFYCEASFETLYIGRFRNFRFSFSLKTNFFKCATRAKLDEFENVHKCASYVFKTYIRHSSYPCMVIPLYIIFNSVH